MGEWRARRSSGIVDRLQAKEIVERRPGVDDRRYVQISAHTERGQPSACAKQRRPDRAAEAVLKGQLTMSGVDQRRSALLVRLPIWRADISGRYLAQVRNLPTPILSQLLRYFFILKCHRALITGWHSWLGLPMRPRKRATT